jgi:hypothetical protein
MLDGWGYVADGFSLRSKCKFIVRGVHDEISAAIIRPTKLLELYISITQSYLKVFDIYLG